MWNSLIGVHENIIPAISYYFLFSRLNRDHKRHVRQWFLFWWFLCVFYAFVVLSCNDVFMGFSMVQPGTYFYHGHHGMQRAAGLYGSLIVDLPKGQNEPFHYDGEFNLLLSDLWHTSSHEQEVGLSTKPLKWIGEPQVILTEIYILFLQFLYLLFWVRNNKCLLIHWIKD